MRHSLDPVHVEGQASDRMIATLTEFAADNADYVYEIKLAGGPFFYGICIIGPWNLCASIKFMATDETTLQEFCKYVVELFQERINRVWKEKWRPNPFI
jgi:hypothetical protein